MYSQEMITEEGILFSLNFTFIIISNSEEDANKYNRQIQHTQKTFPCLVLPSRGQMMCLLTSTDATQDPCDTGSQHSALPSPGHSSSRSPVSRCGTVRSVDP